MSISEVVDVSITEVQSGASLNSFDIPAALAAAADTTPTEYGAAVGKRYPLDVDGLEAIADEWGSGSEAYKAAAKMNSQEEKPAAIYLIKRGAAVATIMTITFGAAVAAGQTISITANGTAISVEFESDAATTYAAAKEALEDVEGIASVVVAGDVLTVTATAEYQMSLAASVTGTGAPTTTLATTEPGRTAADDIADALAEDDTNQWYGLILCDTNKGAQLAAAAAIEGAEKMLFIRSSEAASKTTGGTTSLAYKLNALNYRRTLGLWHHDTTEYIDAGSIAGYLANSPGSIQLANKSLVGVTATPTASLDANAVSVLEGRKFNTYRKFGAYSMIRRGVRVDGNVIEATRDLDYARNELRAEFLTYLSQTKKPSYDEPGFDQVRIIGESVARRLVNEGVFRSDKPVIFFVPAINDVSSSIQSQQVIPSIYLRGTLKKGILEVQINLEIAI